MSLHEVTIRTDPRTGKRRYCNSGAVLDVQLKSTATAVVEASEVGYDLDVNAYNDLRDNKVATPRVLVLHVQPIIEEERLVQTTGRLALAGCCFWASLRGYPEVSNTRSVRIRIPRTNVFSTEWLRQVMRRIADKGSL